MTEELYQDMINDLANKYTNATIECASYRAQLKGALVTLEQMNAVLAKEPALQEFFDETAKKMEEEQHEHE